MLKRMTAWILSLALLTSGASLTAAADTTAGNYDKIAPQLIEEIEKGTDAIPVFFYLNLSDAESEQILTRKQEAAAEQEQIKEQTNALYTQTVEAWRKVLSGEMTRDAYNTILAENTAAYKALRNTAKEQNEQYEQFVRNIIEEAIQRKITALGLDIELAYNCFGESVRDVDTRLITAEVAGKLTPAEILALSEDPDLDSFNYDMTADREQPQPFEPTLTVPDFIPSDFNHDKAVNASDAVTLLRYAAQHGADAFPASFAAFARQQDPFIVQTDKFVYFSTVPYHREDLETPVGLAGTTKLNILGTDANFLVTGIYQDKENPVIKTYTVVYINGYTPEPCYLNGWPYVAGGDSLQVGDLIRLENISIMESYPAQVGCGMDTEFTNYGNACDLFGEAFRKVILHEMIQSQYYITGRNERYEALPAPEEIGDIAELLDEPHDTFGDYSHDGKVNASDAAVMLIYAAEYGADTFQGTFEEYLSR